MGNCFKVSLGKQLWIRVQNMNIYFACNYPFKITALMPLTRDFACLNCRLLCHKVLLVYFSPTYVLSRWWAVAIFILPLFDCCVPLLLASLVQKDFPCKIFWLQTLVHQKHFPKTKLLQYWTESKKMLLVQFKLGGQWCLGNWDHDTMLPFGHYEFSIQPQLQK